MVRFKCSRALNLPVIFGVLFCGAPLYAAGQAAAKDLVVAVENGDLAAVTQALQQGANAGTVAPDYDAQSISVLQLAIDREKCYITLPHPREPLPDGAYYGYYPRVRNPNIAGIVLALLKQGADPNARDQHGVLLLLHAVEGEYSPAIVQALLEHGASPK